MKSIIRKITIFIMLMCAIGTVSARAIVVCEDPDYGALLPGDYMGLVDDVRFFAEKHFRYPPEAWKVQKWYGVIITALIDVDGKVVEYELQTDQTPHPLLMEALQKAMKEMDWRPALKNGVPVASYRDFYMPFTRKSPHGDYWFPIGMEKLFDLADDYVFKWPARKDKHSVPEMRQALRSLGESAVLFPLYAPVSIANARLLATFGQQNMALSHLDNFLKDYQADNYTQEVNDYGDTARTVVMADYKMSNEAWAAVMRTLLRDMMKTPDRDTVYAETLSLFDGLLLMPLSHGMKYLKNIEDSLERDKAAANVNAEKELVLAGRRATTEDDLRLFGLKAMLIWLHDGPDGFHNYIAQMLSRKPTKELQKYLSKLKKNLAKRSAVLADRDEVVRSLALLVPPEGADEAYVRSFYERRSAMEKIFPLKWFTDEPPRLNYY